MSCSACFRRNLGTHKEIITYPKYKSHPYSYKNLVHALKQEGFCFFQIVSLLFEVVHLVALAIYFGLTSMISGGHEFQRLIRSYMRKYFPYFLQICIFFHVHCQSSRDWRMRGAELVQLP